MKKNSNIVIVTPTYNRINTLPKLYRSLLSQNNKEFRWLIIDDGSNDGTREYVEGIQQEELMQITYIFQKNSGKAKALNTAFLTETGASVFVIVDSDDYLLEDAVEIIESYSYKYEKTTNIGAFFFHYKTKDGNILKRKGKMIDNDKLMTRYEYNNKYKLNDGCVCYLNRSVKKYKYPEFTGERYVAPTVIQMQMANEFKIIFSPKTIGVAEYLDGGLSKSGRKLRIKNPNSMIYYTNLMMSRNAKISTQIKYAISIWPYAKLLDKSFVEVLRITKRPFLAFVTYIPGQILTLYWLKSLNKD